MKGPILSCVSAQGIQKDFLLSLSELLSSKNILIKQEIKSGTQAVELELAIPSGREILKADLLNLSNQFQTDIALFLDDHKRRSVRLIVFDMDSTLIQNEVIDEMALVFGIGDKVKKITERAMNGELDFGEALRERVTLLKGLKRSSLVDIQMRLKVTPGVPTVIREVKKRGMKTAIVSGGFLVFAENFRRELGMDYVFANQLEFSNDELTGKVSGKIINAQEKARLLEKLAAQENITMDQVVAVGDGANDLLMLAKAGFGVAYHAKEKVRNEAAFHITHGPMSTLLYYLGMPGDHLHETL